MLTLLTLALVVLTANAAEPLPVPMRGGWCPPGYGPSPTSAYCVPGRNTRCHAIPKLGAACPPGYTTSGAVYCIEIGCQSR